MTEAPETIYLAHADTATEYGVKITEALKPHGYPRGAIEYTRADLARPVTVAEAAKVLLDADIERELAKSMAQFISVKEWEGYKRGVQAYTAALRTLSQK